MNIRISAHCKITAPAALAAGLLISGCATPLETGLISQYRTTADTLYAESNTADQPAPFDSTSTFADYLAYSFSHNPRLKSAFNKWKAALEKIPQARSLQDPSLSFEYLINQYDKRYGATLTQTLPAFGKLSLRNRIAAAEAEAEMHRFETDRFMLYDQTARAFYDYHYLGQSIAITTETLGLLTDLERVIESRYENSQTPFSDLIKIQIEKEQVQEQLDALNDDRRAQSAVLASRVNLKTSEPLPWPTVDPSPDSFLDESFFLEMLEDLNPELKTADAEIQAARTEEQLARRAILPDLLVGANWKTMANDKNDVGLIAGITLPIWQGKIRAGIREAEAKIDAAENKKLDLLNELRAELSIAVVKARDAQRRMTLYSTSLIPKAKQAYQTAREEFVNGSGSFMKLVDAQRMLLEFQLMEQRAVSDREVAMAEIGCCIGQFDLHADPSSQPSEEGASL